MTIWNQRDLSLALNQDLHFEGAMPRMNSLQIKPGDFFIAMKGNKDGHDYIKDALQRGASFAIASKLPNDLTPSEEEKVVVVEDTYEALMNLAKYRRNQSKAKFIAITGSSGKTSTKTNLENILSYFGKTFANEGNFNNHLGVPLTLASISLDCQYVVTEIGMNQKGEIKPLAQMVKPDIAIVTSILPAHIGNFKSLEEIAQEKGQVFQCPIQNSYAIINREDDAIFDILKKSAISNGVRTVLTFGHTNCNSNLLKYELINKKLAAIKINLGGVIYEFKTAFIGKHNSLNLISIILTACCLDLNIDKVIDLIEKCEAVNGRGKFSEIENFSKHFEIIDDSYNANPGSVKASLEHLSNIQSGQKVAVLGDMLELGANSVKYHQAILDDLKNAGVYKFIAVGELMKNLYDLVEGIEKHYFANYQELIKKIPEIVKNNDLILFKGSKSCNIHKVVEFIKAK